MWSINTKGPTERFWRKGNKRPTIKLPMDAARSSIIREIFDMEVDFGQR
jgi:hypothetical protein